MTAWEGGSQSRLCELGKYSEEFPMSMKPERDVSPSDGELNTMRLQVLIINMGIDEIVS